MIMLNCTRFTSTEKKSEEIHGTSHAQYSIVGLPFFYIDNGLRNGRHFLPYRPIDIKTQHLSSRNFSDLRMRQVAGHN